MSGIDADLINILKESPIECVYAGGISSIDDLEIINKIGEKIDATIGSALDIYGGSLEFKKVINYFNQKS